MFFLVLLLAAALCATRVSSFAAMLTGRRRSYHRVLKMDDEVARTGIKVELTTRDEYLETRFTKLSESGHDLTPLLPSELDRLRKETISDNFSFLSFRKGLYCAKIGGLPMFASGDRLDDKCSDDELVFQAPCDPEHIWIDDDNNFHCKRTGLVIGRVDTENCLYRVKISEGTLNFHALDKPFPVQSQPESYWGSEDQWTHRRQMGEG